MIKRFYLEPRCFVALAGVVCTSAAGYLYPPFLSLGRVALLVLAALVVIDVLLLARSRDGLLGHRSLPARLSNGDDNDVWVHVTNRYPFPITTIVFDELPVQLQSRDHRYCLTLASGEDRTIRYTVTPRSRGSYVFGELNLYARSPVGLVSRRYRFEGGASVPVYPSFLRMSQYELLAGTNRLNDVGVKPVRRLGHTMEFDHIQDYVTGDDPGTINWKATARHGSLKVNRYQDERGQPVYCLINTGRVMKMPFDGMTLLDYSINASLVLSKIALLKYDRAGLILYSNEVHAMLPADRRSGQIHRIQQMLYNVKEAYREPDHAVLVSHVRRHVRTRSLLVLFTNFESKVSLKRQLPYLQMLARDHVLVVVFYENTELTAFVQKPSASVDDVYTKTMAEKFIADKQEIVAELRRHGITSVLAAPQHITPRTINTYLDLKARGKI